MIISRLGIKTLVYYLSTSLLAIITGLFLVNIIKPGNNYIQPPNIDPKELLSGPASFMDMIYRIVPTNPLSSMVNGDMLSIIFFSLLFGFSITKIRGKHKETLHSFIVSLHESVMYLTGIIIRIAPIGVFGLIIKAVHHSNTNIIPSIGMYMITILIGLLFHLFITLPCICYITSKISPIIHYKAMSKAMLTAFSTSSSSATLPVTMECVEDNLGVDKKITSFVLPIGATVNMDGTCLYQAVAVVFLAQLHMIDLTIA